MTVTRTVVTGQIRSLIECLLFLLTYFIRCYDVEDIYEMEPTELGSRCSSVTSGHITPKNDHDFPSSFKSSRELQSTPSKKKPNPFSFPSIKSPIPRSRNISQSEKESCELSSLYSSSAGSLKSSPSHTSKIKESTSRSWQRQKLSLHNSDHFSSEGDLTSCSGKAVTCGLSDDRATPASCDDSDNVSLYTNVPASPLFRRHQSGQKDRSNTAEESAAILPSLSGDCLNNGIRFSTKCQDYLQSCEGCSRASTPELQCSEESLLKHTCRLTFQTSSQCFIPHDTCHQYEKQHTYSHKSSNTDKPKPTGTLNSNKSHKKEPRCSQAVCENPFYIVFDPNCSYSSQRQKYRPVDKPQVCTRLPLIWPQNSWDLPEDDPFDNGGQIIDKTTQCNDKQRDGSDSLWPHNSSGFFDATGHKKETDLIFPHNASEYSVSNTSPDSKDSGNSSCTTTSRLDNESITTNEESSGESKWINIISSN